MNIESRKHNFNRNIFDAAIVATAIVKDLPLITRDNAITYSGVIEAYWYSPCDFLWPWIVAVTFDYALVELN